MSAPHPPVPPQHSRPVGSGSETPVVKPLPLPPSLPSVRSCVRGRRGPPWAASSGASQGAERGSRRERGRGSEPLAWPSPPQAHVPYSTADALLRREAWCFPPPQPQRQPGRLTPIWERRTHISGCSPHGYSLGLPCDHRATLGSAPGARICTAEPR